MKTRAENLLSTSSTLPEVLRRLGLFSKTSLRLSKLEDKPRGGVGSRKPMNAGMLWRGEVSTLNSSDSPIAGSAFLLLDILEGRKPSTAPSLSRASLLSLIQNRQLPRKLEERVKAELARPKRTQSR